MTATKGWSGQPGIPDNPSEDGWHWIIDAGGEKVRVFWIGHGGDTHYWNGDLKPSIGWSNYPLMESTIDEFTYLGPCLTYDEEVALKSSAAERDALKEKLDAAARVLHKAGEQFTFYANEHSAKGTVTGNVKAETNRKWAERCYNAHDAALFGQGSTFVVPARNFGKSSGNVRNMLSAQSREIDRLRAELGAHISKEKE